MQRRLRLWVINQPPRHVRGDGQRSPEAPVRGYSRNSGATRLSSPPVGFSARDYGKQPAALGAPYGPHHAAKRWGALGSAQAPAGYRRAAVEADAAKEKAAH
jgi:hypothetical protein